MEKWKVKSYIKAAMIVNAFGFFGTSISFITLYILEKQGYVETGFNFGLIIGILLLLFLSFTVISITPIGIMYINSNIHKKRNEVDSEEYYRDIDNKYTPAIASFLIDYKIEGNEGLLATILDLHVKKYLNVFKKNEKLEIEVINENTDDLYLHEKYIIDKLKKKELIEIEEFKSKVIEDCLNNELVIEKEENQIWYKLFKYTIEAFFILGMASSVFQISIIKKLFKIDIALFCLIIIILIAMNSYTRTNKGKELAVKFKGLRGFLKDYTLMSERDINYLNISERYLPFALALGVANKLENSYVECNKLISNYVKQLN